jgi:hypothetical protein
MIKIRKNVFETNSSSTHSIAIKPDGWTIYKFCGELECDTDSPYIPIKVEQTLETYSSKYFIIETSNWYKRGGGYYYVYGDLQKIQFFVSYLSNMISLFKIDLQPKELPYFRQITKAIHDHIQEKYDIYYVDVVFKEGYRDGSFLDDLIGRYWRKNDYTPEEVYNIMKKVISDDTIVFICHSDESGPYPEDIGLIDVDRSDYRKLLDGYVPEPKIEDDGEDKSFVEQLFDGEIE